MDWFFDSWSSFAFLRWTQFVMMYCLFVYWWIQLGNILLYFYIYIHEFYWSIFFFSYNVCVLFCYQGIYGLLKILKLFPPFLFIYFINLLKRISFDFIFSIFFCFEFQCLLFFIIFSHLFDIGLIFSSNLLKRGLRLLIWYLCLLKYKHLNATNLLNIALASFHKFWYAVFCLYAVKNIFQFPFWLL